MKLKIALFLMLAAGIAKADTVNPASNVTADSANTASTIVLRDSSNNFAAGTITANLTGNVTGNNVPADSATGRNHIPVLSTTTVTTTTPGATGDLIYVNRGGGVRPYLCVSTGTTVCGYSISNSTGVDCWH